MDIGKIGSNIIKLPDYSAQQKQQSENKEDVGVVLEMTSQRVVKSEKTLIYTNPKLAGDQLLIEKFFNFTNKEIGNQMGSLKAYIQGYLDGSDGSQESIDKLESLLLERYGIEGDLDAANVEEGGYYSAEATSDRLVEFAMNISGGDVSKADMLMDAMKKGFELAADTWGGELPEISQNTYDLAVEKFEAWKNGSLGAE